MTTFLRQMPASRLRGGYLVRGQHGATVADIAATVFDESYRRPVKGGGPLDYVSRWRLNEGAGTAVADSGRQGTNAGTLIGAPAPAWVEGRDGRALSFAGGAVRIASASGLGLVQEAHTISCWLKVAAWATTATIVIFRDTAGTAANSINLAAGKITVARWGGAVMAQASFVPSLGQWHHVCWTCTGDTGIGSSGVGVLYVDGIPFEGADVFLQYAPIQQIYFSGYDGSNDPYVGDMDDVRFYNRALSAPEVAAIHAGDFASIASGQAALFI